MFVLANDNFTGKKKKHNVSSSDIQSSCDVVFLINKRVFGRQVWLDLIE